jgi:XTP/dITP diphosphohydrolase
MEKLIFATNNEHKLSEVKQMLEGLYQVIGLEEAGIFEDIPENEPTLEGNARFKARFIHEKFNMNVFADDTGLEIESLNGEPGVFSARYAGEAKNSDNNMKKVLFNLSNSTNRSAQFRTVLCLILNYKEFLFEGIVKGEILEKPIGHTGFGYDPIFKPEGHSLSFAEMGMKEKNEISHRGRAIQKFVQHLKSKTK